LSAVAAADLRPCPELLFYTIRLLHGDDTSVDGSLESVPVLVSSRSPSAFRLASSPQYCNHLPQSPILTMTVHPPERYATDNSGDGVPEVEYQLYRGAIHDR